MSGLPTLIPTQSTPIATDSNGRPLNVEINWWLWLYNLSVQVFGTGGGGGTTPVSPYDALDAAQMLAQTADVPQAFRQIQNLTALLQSTSALQDPAPAAQPAQTISVGASPFTFTALFNGVLSVTGGTVSNVSIIRQGVSVATGITSSSTSAVTSMVDEKGSGGQPGFVNGVDFTAGTTTNLTLSQAYSSADDLWIAFDGVEQGANGYTLSGTTLTFGSPIPLGTTDVFVKGAVTTTINSSGGLVPVRRLDQVQITYSVAPTVVFLPA